MHYYQFNVGDYIKHTNHLTPEEDITYRRLLDLYYDTEQPIPTDIPLVSRRIRMGSEVTGLVLKEFFILDGNCYRSRRADQEIAEYHAYLTKQKLNGAKGGRPKSRMNAEDKPTVNPVVNPDQTQNNPKHKPLTTNHKPINNIIPAKADEIDFELFWNICPKKTARQDAEKAWKKLKPDQQIFDEISRHLSMAYLSTEKKFIPNGATYLNGKRWMDEVITVPAFAMAVKSNHGEQVSFVDKHTNRDWAKPFLNQTGDKS